MCIYTYIYMMLSQEVAAGIKQFPTTDGIFFYGYGVETVTTTYALLFLITFAIYIYI
jgi:hypothetical protein